jgi:hypothetical protein
MMWNKAVVFRRRSEDGTSRTGYRRAGKRHSITSNTRKVVERLLRVYGDDKRSQIICTEEYCYVEELLFATEGTVIPTLAYFPRAMSSVRIRYQLLITATRNNST